MNKEPGTRGSLLSGCGSVWLEHLVWDQGVAGSNPVTPIIYILSIYKVWVCIGYMQFATLFLYVFTVS